MNTPARFSFTCFYAVLMISVFAALSLQAPSASAAEKKYRFVMVSHIGSNDPNMKWLALSLEAFEKKYPDDKTESTSTNQYSIQEHIRLIEQAIATKPDDGIAVSIVSADAFEGPLRKAIKMGI